MVVKQGETTPSRSTITIYNVLSWHGSGSSKTFTLFLSSPLLKNRLGLKVIVVAVAEGKTGEQRDPKFTSFHFDTLSNEGNPRPSLQMYAFL
jgi:hypothetical protein